MSYGYTADGTAIGEAAQDDGQARPFSVQEAIDTGDATAVRDAVQRELRDTGRTDILKKAAELVHGPRHDEYGDAFENFSRIASLWRHILGVPVSPEQVALCMIAVKVARLCNTSDHEDSWTDIAGYAALGAELR